MTFVANKGHKVGKAEDISAVDELVLATVNASFKRSDLSSRALQVFPYATTRRASIVPRCINRWRRTWLLSSIRISRRRNSYVKESISSDGRPGILRAASGQSRHFGRRPTTSGPPLETDIVRAGRHVSKVPCVDGSELARTFFTYAALVGAAVEFKRS